jgi:hypothetical protein
VTGGNAKGVLGVSTRVGASAAGGSGADAGSGVSRGQVIASLASGTAVTVGFGFRLNVISFFQIDVSAGLSDLTVGCGCDFGFRLREICFFQIDSAGFGVSTAG